MALIANMDSIAPGDTGHVDGSTLNAPRTKTVQGDEINAVGWGAVSCLGTTGSISVQQIIGYEDADNIHPATFQRIDTGDGEGFGDWLKIG